MDYATKYEAKQKKQAAEDLSTRVTLALPKAMATFTALREAWTDDSLAPGNAVQTMDMTIAALGRAVGDPEVAEQMLPEFTKWATTGFKADRAEDVTTQEKLLVTQRRANAARQRLDQKGRLQIVLQDKAAELDTTLRQRVTEGASPGEMAREFDNGLREFAIKQDASVEGGAEDLEKMIQKSVVGFSARALAAGHEANMAAVKNLGQVSLDRQANRVLTAQKPGDRLFQMRVYDDKLDVEVGLHHMTKNQADRAKSTLSIESFEQQLVGEPTPAQIIDVETQKNIAIKHERLNPRDWTAAEKMIQASKEESDSTIFEARARRDPQEAAQAVTSGNFSQFKTLSRTDAEATVLKWENVHRDAFEQAVRVASVETAMAGRGSYDPGAPKMSKAADQVYTESKTKIPRDAPDAEMRLRILFREMGQNLPRVPKAAISDITTMMNSPDVTQFNVGLQLMGALGSRGQHALNDLPDSLRYAHFLAQSRHPATAVKTAWQERRAAGKVQKTVEAGRIAFAWDEESFGTEGGVSRFTGDLGDVGPGVEAAIKRSFNANMIMFEGDADAARLATQQFTDTHFSTYRVLGEDKVIGMGPEHAWPEVTHGGDQAFVRAHLNAVTKPFRDKHDLGDDAVWPQEIQGSRSDPSNPQPGKPMYQIWWQNEDVSGMIFDKKGRPAKFQMPVDAEGRLEVWQQHEGTLPISAVTGEAVR